MSAHNTDVDTASQALREGRLSPREYYTPRSSTRAGTIRRAHAGWVTLCASLVLSLIGVYVIDLTAGVGATGIGYHAKRQLVFLGVGMVACCVVAFPSVKVVRRLAPLLVIGSAVLLVFVLVPLVPEAIVTPRNGARRWISLGFTDFQPSELAKIAYVLSVSMYLRRRKNHRTLPGLLLPALITLVPMGLIVLEPDLGTALLFMPTLFAMLVAAGARLWHLALIVVVLGGTAPAMYPMLKPHQKQRIRAMVNQITGDTSEADGINYQGFKSMTLVGAGGITGMEATLSRAVVDFNELPEDHNDMVFAVIVNRFGLLGGLGVMGLYLAWVGGTLWVASGCRDAFSRIVCVGLAALIASQAVFNMGIAVGLLPVTGMTLPFISYGGTSLVSVYVMTGLIFGIAMRREAPLARQSFEFSRAGS
ncbi:MAG: FtsW/RodA/SpoVE family cell cycle protein [Planctomycetota bacterium]|jgi:cell division protein FtsW (lipid II flippase)